MLSSSRCQKKCPGLESSGSWSVEPTSLEKGSGAGATSLEQSTGCHVGGIELVLLPNWMIPLRLNDLSIFTIKFVRFLAVLIYSAEF